MAAFEFHVYVLFVSVLLLALQNWTEENKYMTCNRFCIFAWNCIHMFIGHMNFDTHVCTLIYV